MNDPGSAFRNEPGTMRPAPALSDQLSVDNDARLAMYLGFASILCFPTGWAAAFLGIRAVGRARAVGMSTPGTAIVGIAISVCTSLCFGSTMVIGALAPKSTNTTDSATISEPRPEEEEEAPPPVKDDTVAVQPGAGRGPHLELRITKIYEQRQPSAKPPYHQPGGDWTFFDLEAGEGVALTAGLQFKKSSEMFSFGKAQLSVNGPEAGAAFTSAFDAQFGGKRGKLKAHRGPLQMGVAVLGQDMVRSHGGGFRSGRFGKWTATKLFPELGGRQGEVFFNYSLEDQVAELTEKDADYADDLAFVFGSAFAGK